MWLWRPYKFIAYEINEWGLDLSQSKLQAIQKKIVWILTNSCAGKQARPEGGGVAKSKEGSSIGARLALEIGWIGS